MERDDDSPPPIRRTIPVCEWCLNIALPFDMEARLREDGEPCYGCGKTPVESQA